MSMGTRAAIVAAAIGLAGLVGGGTAPGATERFAGLAEADSPDVSSNWSGYAAVAPTGTDMSFSDVTATWRQPKGKCTADRSDSAVFWVGLGGISSSSGSLEQLGTEMGCRRAGALPRYSAWWEIIPAPPVSIPLKVAGGDKIGAALLVDGQTLTFSLRNLTRHTRFTKRLTVAQTLDLSSAEWIAEAPSLCSSANDCRVVPLTRFGSVTFTNAALTGNAHTGTIADPTWSANPIELISSGQGSPFFGGSDPLGPGVGAVPGALGADGRSFTVTWQRSVTPP
jgi:peptidase A4-like protein